MAAFHDSKILVVVQSTKDSVEVSRLDARGSLASVLLENFI